MLATIMQAVDTTIANVALPHIQGSLSASQDQVGWVLTSYIVAAAIMTPLTGWLAGRFGIKRIFLASVAGFTVASALCGVAGNLGEMVIYRLLQGVCGAALVPLCAGRIAAHQPSRTTRPRDGGVGHRRHGRADLRTDARRLADRQLQLALGVLHQPAGRHHRLLRHPLVHPRDPARRTAKPFDFFGFAALSIAIGALQLMLDRGELKDWFGSTEIWIEATIAGLALYLFVVHTITAGERSFLNRQLLRTPIS